MGLKMHDHLLLIRRLQMHLPDQQYVTFTADGKHDTCSTKRRQAAQNYFNRVV